MHTRKTLQKFDYFCGGLNIKKTKKMQLNQPKDANITKQVVDRQEIAVVDDCKYLGLHLGSHLVKQKNT